MNIEHVALNVADPVAMTDWYTRHLGMRVVRAVEGPTNTRFLCDESGRVVVEIYHHSRAPVPDYRAMDPLVLHLAFVAPDIRAASEQLVTAGATRDGDVTRTPNGDELAFVRDPWGVVIQLVSRAKPLLPS